MKIESTFLGTDQYFKVIRFGFNVEAGEYQLPVEKFVPLDKENLPTADGLELLYNVAREQAIQDFRQYVAGQIGATTTAATIESSKPKRKRRTNAEIAADKKREAEEAEKMKLAKALPDVRLSDPEVKETQDAILAAEPEPETIQVPYVKGSDNQRMKQVMADTLDVILGKEWRTDKEKIANGVAVAKAASEKGVIIFEGTDVAKTFENDLRDIAEAHGII